MRRAISVLLIVGGAAGALAGLVDVLDELRTRAWPATSAVIVGMEPTYTYRYTAGGVERVSDGLGAGRRLAGALLAWLPRDRVWEARIRTRQIGRTVTLHYDPARPATAVRAPGVSQASLGVVAGGAILAALGALRLAWGRRARGTRRPRP